MGQRALLAIIGILVVLVVFLGGVVGSRYVFNPIAANHPPATLTPSPPPTASATREPTLTATAAPRPTATTSASPTRPVATPIRRPTMTPAPTATHTPRPRPSAATIGRDTVTNPADVVTHYYGAVNHRDFARAYGYITGAFKSQTAEHAFAAGYAETQSVTVARLVPASYRLLTDTGLTLTCVGFEIVAHSKAGPSEAYGGWYKTLRGTGPWSIDLALSYSTLNAPATVPSAKRCGRGLRVVGLAPVAPSVRPIANRATSTNTPQPGEVKPTRPAQDATSLPQPSATMRSVAPPLGVDPTLRGASVTSLLNVSGFATIQKSRPFQTTGGSFTISWDGRLADHSTSNSLFSITLYGPNGSYGDLADGESNTPTVHGSKIESIDCTGSCYLQIESDNMLFNVVVQDNASGNDVASVPAEPRTPYVVTSDNPVVQDVLNFTPACTSVQVNGQNIADRVEYAENLDSYVGSKAYPGTFTRALAVHGAHIVIWTLPNKHQYQFQLSEDGSVLTYMNNFSQVIGC